MPRNRTMQAAGVSSTATMRGLTNLLFLSGTRGTGKLAGAPGPPTRFRAKPGRLKAALIKGRTRDRAEGRRNPGRSAAGVRLTAELARPA